MGCCELFENIFFPLFEKIILDKHLQGNKVELFSGGLFSRRESRILLFREGHSDFLEEEDSV